MTQKITAQLIEQNLLDQINTVVIANANDNDSLGMQLAKQHNAKSLPFFIVKDESHSSPAKLVTIDELIDYLNQH